LERGSMANRSYLYSLSNRPKSYSDRPDTISGLSEWNYQIPFFYLLLLSGDPQVSASLVSDGFEEEDDPSGLYALTGDFELGMARAKKFLSTVSMCANQESGIAEATQEALEFLNAHKDKYFLLETIELDCMSPSDGPDYWKNCVEYVRGEAIHAGLQVDKLSKYKWRAKKQLKEFEFSMNADFDAPDAPMGIGYWTDILYFALQNKAEFAANNP
ncbi:MAG: hypothetical protein ACPGVT_07360, partial [Maricaulaceae bacterium]